MLRAIPPVSTCPFRMGETKLILGQSDDVGPLSFIRGALLVYEEGADWPKGRMVTRGADVVVVVEEEEEELTRLDETP